MSLTPESKSRGRQANATPAAAHPGGMQLRALRQQIGKTQLLLEADAGLGSGYVQRIESGKVQ